MEFRGFIPDTSDHQVEAGPVDFIGLIGVGRVGEPIDMAVNVADQAEVRWERPSL